MEIFCTLIREQNQRVLNFLKVQNGQTNELIRFHGWSPANICVISTGEILVNGYDDNKTRSKVVRVSYLESTDKQTT